MENLTPQPQPNVQHKARGMTFEEARDEFFKHVAEGKRDIAAGHSYSPEEIRLYFQMYKIHKGKK